MSWETYRKNKTKEYTFESIGAPDFWVKMISMDTMRYGESKELREDTEKIQEESSDDDELMRKLLSRYIIAWNLTDPDTDEPMPVPSKDISALDKLPMDFIAQLNLWLEENSALKEMVPNARESFSGQL